MSKSFLSHKYYGILPSLSAHFRALLHDEVGKHYQFYTPKTKEYGAQLKTQSESKKSHHFEASNIQCSYFSQVLQAPDQAGLRNLGDSPNVQGLQVWTLQGRVPILLEVRARQPNTSILWRLRKEGKKNQCNILLCS